MELLSVLTLFVRDQ